MDRRLLPVVIGIVAIVAAAIVAVLVFAPPTPPGSAPSSPPAADGSGTTESTTPAAASTGAYIDYTDDAIAQADGRVLLFFHAPWCPKCRAIDSDILTQGVPDGVTIIKVDYDSRQDLRQQYGVTLQSTFIEVDTAGTALQKYVAYDEPSLDAVIAAML